jgi:hypothetical protein
MSILFGFGSEKELDKKLDELVTPILQAIHTDQADPEFDQMLRTLRLLRGPDTRDINAQILRTRDGSVLLHVGRGLYDFLQFYCRCISTKFLPDRPGGSRPSPAWSEALPALASSLEWLALPMGEVRFADLPLSSTQDNTATTFANMTYRAAICHEIAHVVLGHLDAIAKEGEQTTIDEDTKLRNSHERETDADLFGMRLHLDSLPHPAMMVTAAATLIYNMHGTNLLRLRLMALAEIIDTYRWTRRIRHPDPLLRFGFLAVNAGTRYGRKVADGMTMVHNDLETIDGEIRECMFKQQESVRDEILGLARSAADGPGGLGPQLDRLLSRSPVGVIQALDLLGSDSPSVAAHLTEAMPRPVQRFVALPFGDRTGRALNRVT